MKSHTLKGTLLILLAAIAWGLGGVSCQFIYQSMVMDPVWLVTARQIIAGVLFLLFASWHENIFIILKKDLVSIVAFSFIGIFGSQFGFFYTIYLCNAATATVLQYTAPIFVMLWIAYKNRKIPDHKELLGIVFAVVGVFLISTHGNLDEVVLSPLILLVGLYSAVTYACYTVMPVDLLKRYTTATVLGWGQLLSGLGLALYSNPLTVSHSWTTGAIYAFAFLVIVSTLFSFSCYLMGLKIIGPTKASLISCAEPLASIVAVVLLLDTVLTVEDYIGMSCIIFTVLVLSLPKK